MALIQPMRQGQLLKPVRGKRLLLVDPYPRNSRYHLTASERRQAIRRFTAGPARVLLATDAAS